MLTDIWRQSWQWLQALLDIFYPPRCPKCRRLLDGAQGSWCPECLQQTLSVRWLQPLPHIFRHLDGCLALSHYQGTVRRLIRVLKFQRQRKAAAFLATLAEFVLNESFLQQLPQNNTEAATWLVVPIPLHTERLHWRGFNQAELIFRSWVEKGGNDNNDNNGKNDNVKKYAIILQWLDCLQRVKDTRPQWRLGQEERRKNIKDAFILTRPGNDIRGKKIILVDDICTTGITLEEGAKVLKSAGAVCVIGLVLASEAAACISQAPQ